MHLNHAIISAVTGLATAQGFARMSGTNVRDIASRHNDRLDRGPNHEALLAADVRRDDSLPISNGIAPRAGSDGAPGGSGGSDGAPGGSGGSDGAPGAPGRSGGSDGAPGAPGTSISSTHPQTTTASQPSSSATGTTAGEGSGGSGGNGGQPTDPSANSASMPGANVLACLVAVAGLTL